MEALSPYRKAIAAALTGTLVAVANAMSLDWLVSLAPLYTTIVIYWVPNRDLSGDPSP